MKPISTLEHKLKRDNGTDGISNGVKLIIGAIGKDRKIFANAKQRLCKKFGTSDYESDFFHFNFTDYYYKEMGSPLLRKFYAFKKPVSADKLMDIKLFTNEIEDICRNRDNSRRINLDPGYIEEGKLILSTHKNHQHRVYLGKGVFAEVTLRYNGGTFKPWEWTYPDYRTQEYIQFFNKIRDDWLDISQRLSKA